MRAFIAVEPPDKIKGLLAQIQTRLQSCRPDVKWVEPANIHLTLKFLGEVQDRELKITEKILGEACGRQSIFTAKIESVDAFPDNSLPRVIWAGISQGDKELKSLAAELEEMTSQETGMPKEKRAFTSHLTLGRARSGAGGKRLLEELERINREGLLQAGDFTIEKITLYQSTLTPQGPLYTPLKEINLKTP